MEARFYRRGWLISTEEANLYGGVLFQHNRLVVVVVAECLYLYGKKEPLHRGDEFLYKDGFV